MKGPLYHVVLMLLSAYTASLAAADSENLAETNLPETCHLFAHFYANGDSGMHLAWSPDGLEWKLLNGGKGLIVPAVGESRLMRDPSLVRGGDGRFHMVWTTAWSGRTIGHASSTDLVNWSEQRLIPVMEHDPRAQNCWAPEIHFIEEDDLFLILWSTTILGEFAETALSNRRHTRNHRIYYTTTRDFVEFSPTRLYYDGGFNVIDAALSRDGEGGWLLFVKNESYSPRVEKNIRMIRARTWRGPFSAPSAPISGGEWAEGPSPLFIDGRLHVYFDKHDIGHYGVVRSRDLVEWEDLSDQTRFPEHARHGTFLSIPRPLMETLLRTIP